MAEAKTAAKKVAKKVEKTDEGFLLLIVFKVTHGGLFNKHSHYTSNLMKAKDNDEARTFTKAAKAAAERMTNDMGTKTEVVISERVKAVDHAEMHSQVSAKISDAIGALLKAI